MKETGNGLLKMAILNIQGVSLESMEVVLKCLSNLHIDVCILTETNLTYYYPKRSQGYYIYSEESNQRRGGVAFAIRAPKKQASWHMEGISYHGRNVIKGTLISGVKKWIICGLYLSPTLDPSTELDQLQR